MTKTVRQGILAGIKITKPKLFKILLWLRTKDDEAIQRVEKVFLNNHLYVQVGSENFGVLDNSLISR